MKAMEFYRRRFYQNLTYPFIKQDRCPGIVLLCSFHSLSWRCPCRSSSLIHGRIPGSLDMNEQRFLLLGG
ncbi:MAG: hypothetical protein OJF50_004943 [Nitrospira sp.]|nr:hypothetical protein [Nitrospira sp.]